MVVSRTRQKEKKRRTGFRSLFIVTASTAMIATGGFGAFPENSLTQTFQEVISESFPDDFLNPFNSYLENIAAPTIPPQPASPSQADSQPDPLGVIESWFADDASATETQPPIEQEIVDSAMTSVAGTQTLLASIPTNTTTFTTTPSLTLSPPPSFTSLPSATSTFTSVPTPTVVWIYISPTNTPKPKPANTATVIPSTATPFVLETGSCVVNSPDTSTYGCQISNIRLDGILQSSLNVSAPGQVFTLQYDYQAWTDPVCPTCALYLIAGMESNPAVNCDYGGAPGIYPGASGTSSIHSLTAPASSGNWAIFIRWVKTTGCDTNNYDGFGSVIANVNVP